MSSSGRRVPLVLLSICMVLLSMTPASAIIGGTPDTEHVNVGAIIAEVDSDGAGPDSPVLEFWCSGSLLSPSHFLTAGHCTLALDSVDFLGRVWVTFDQDLRADPDDLFVVDPINLYAVHRWDTHPGIHCVSATCFNDLGVLTLESPINRIAPIELPLEGSLDAQSARGGLRGHSFVNVGYGTGKPDRSFLSPNVNFSWDGVRRVSTSPFSALTKAQLFLQENVSATGEGGDCGGDSGSPKFLEPVPGPRANLVAGVLSSGDPKCQALSQSQRLDTAAAREFLDNFVTVP